MLQRNLQAALLSLKEAIRNSRRQPVRVVTYAGSFMVQRDQLGRPAGLDAYRSYVTSNRQLRLVATSTIDATIDSADGTPVTTQQADAPASAHGLHTAILNSAIAVARRLPGLRLALQ